MVKGWNPLTIYAYTIKMRKRWNFIEKLREKIADRRKIPFPREIPLKLEICCKK